MYTHTHAHAHTQSAANTRERDVGLLAVTDSIASRPNRTARQYISLSGANTPRGTSNQGVGNTVGSGGSTPRSSSRGEAYGSARDHDAPLASARADLTPRGNRCSLNVWSVRAVGCACHSV